MTATMSKKELQEELTKRGVKFAKSATVAVLQALLDAEGSMAAQTPEKEKQAPKPFKGEY